MKLKLWLSWKIIRIVQFNLHSSPSLQFSLPFQWHQSLNEHFCYFKDTLISTFSDQVQLLFPKVIRCKYEYGSLTGSSFIALNYVQTSQKLQAWVKLYQPAKIRRGKHQALNLSEFVFNLWGLWVYFLWLGISTANQKWCRCLVHPWEITNYYKKVNKML